MIVSWVRNHWMCSERQPNWANQLLKSFFANTMCPGGKKPLNLPRTAAELSKSQVGKAICKRIWTRNKRVRIPQTEQIWYIRKWLSAEWETIEFAENGSRTEQFRGSKDTLENDCQLSEKPLNLLRTAAELSKSIGQIICCKYNVPRRQETIEFA